MKLRFHGVGCAPKDTMERNSEYCRSLGLPDVGQSERTRLAVIGGGHSVADYVDELRDFDGDRWIVAGAFPWCKSFGIDGWFFAIGPEPHIADLTQGVEKAVLASSVAPGVFDNLKGAKIRVLELISEGEMINHGPSTVTAAFVHAIYAGYREITFYGCDSSYAKRTTHAYEDHPEPLRIMVRCAGEDFYTTPVMLLQAEYMATMIRTAPNVFKEKSGGLLGAMVKDLDWDVTAGSPELCDLIGYERQAA